MKAKPIFKWLVLAGTSMALSLATATAEPEKEKSKPDRAENKAGDKAEKAHDKADKKAGPAENRSDKKTDQAENRQEKKAENRAENQQEKRADNRAENRAERRIYKKGEFKERFQDRDRDRIVTYFSAHKGRDRGLPPGLAQRWESGKRLPNGWRDRVVTGYVIESDWFPAFEPVPYDWFPEIVIVPDTRLYWYGDRVVRVYEPTREVVDVVIIPTIHIDL